ncbi:MAG: HYR domain-containing protein [Saprospiraceae bacterium]|nr:HYR domain-containing protein [Saprospiraceae bacterium]
MKKYFPNVLVTLCLIITINGNLLSNNTNVENNSDLCFACLTAPIIICPSTYFGCPTDSTDPANTGFPVALPGDPNCPIPLVFYTDVIVTDTACLKVIHRTWSAEYPPGSASAKLRSQCQQTIFLEDVEVPVIENCPADITINLANDCQAVATWTTPTATDDCGIQNLIPTDTSGTSFPLGTTTVIYTAQDLCGLTDICSFNVTVEGVCCSSIDIICPTDQSVCVGGDISPANTGTAIGLSNEPTCPTPIISYADSIIQSGPCSGAMLIERTWTATQVDDPNNQISCTQLINVSDLQNPVISNIPPDITVTGFGSGCSVPVTWTAPTAVDNCNVASFTANHTNGSSFPEGSTVITYTALDDCGNSATGTFQITVLCDLSCVFNPIILCPDDFQSCPSDTIPDPSVSGIAFAIPGSADCNQPLLTYSDSILISGPCTNAKTIQRTWTATDPDDASLNASCIQLINLIDTLAPTIANVPQDLTLSGSGTNCSVQGIWSIPNAADNCGIMSFESDVANGSFFFEGTTDVTYTATDSCGNATSVTFQVIVECTPTCETAPILICPNPFSSCPSTTIPDPSISGFAFASPGDTLCQSPIVTYSDSIISSGPCAGVMEIERTWIATDPDNASLITTCVQNISLQDNTPPTLSGVPSDVTISGYGNGCAVPFSWTSPTANDNCNVASLTSSVPNGSAFYEGITTIIFTASDDCGNTTTDSFAVTVNCIPICISFPILTCPSDYTGCPDASIPDPSISGYAIGTPGSTDCNPPIVTYNDLIISVGPCIGQKVVERIWTATDPNNPFLSVSCTQIITLIDDEAPVISNIPSDITVTGFGNNCEVPVSWTNPFANDNCGISGMSSNIANGSNLPQGVSTITYTAIDVCGNTAVASFNITVNCISNCTVPPVINCPANYWACPDGTIPSPSESGYATATAGSSDCEDPIVTYSDIIIVSSPCGAKVVERKWTATDPDDSSLFSTCTQILSLEDIVPPTIIYCPSDVTVTSNTADCDSAVSWNSPLATDNCNAPDLTAVDQNGNPVYNGAWFNEGYHTITYTATDLCGNISSCSFNISVSCAPQCDVPPTIYCPSNKVICPGSNSSPSVLGWATAYGGPNCPNPNITYQDIITSTGPCYGEKVIHRTWTASYPSGSNLTSSCVQVIEAKDTHAPSFANCPSDITVNNNTVLVNWTPPYATDFCSTPSVTSNYTPGSYFPVGTTTVYYTAEDNCGNSSVCHFNVTVLYDNSATLTCPDDILLTCGTNGGAIANWVPPVYEGTCADCSSVNPISGFVYMGTFNGNQYYCSTAPATWHTAKAICEDNGGYLARINDAAENSFLANILTLQSAWIGLSDINNEGTFTWTNGESPGYTNWYPGQPNNYNNNQDYVEMLNNGQWNDQYNHYALEFIMEIPCTYIQQTAGPEPGSFLTGGRYTVSYAMSDACGSSATCSFEIVVEGGLNLTCPNDIVMSAPANSPGVIVDWQDPTAHTCCSSCNDSAGGPIQGFVYMGAFGGHHYYCSTQPKEWNTAQQTCINNGGHLAVINSAEENNFLANILTLQSAWIGCSDAQNEGTFEWVNGDALNYTNWYPGQPNDYNYNQDYVELLNNGQWNDQYNTYALEYIMEIPGCLNVVQTSGPSPGSVLPPGSNHVVTYLATDGCGNSAECSFNIEVESIPVNTTYCTSSSVTSFNYYIDSVVFGQLNNQSGNNGGYADFTNMCVNIDENQSYPLQLDPGYEGQPDDKVYWKVWIDYNLDGDFEDAGEEVAYGCGTTTLSGVIVTPQILWPGKSVMRVIMKPGSYPTSPCGIYQHGETEDYCLTIWGTGTSKENDDINSRSRGFNPVLLKSEMEKTKVSIYPNPAVDRINIEIDNHNGVENILILNAQGQIMYKSDKYIQRTHNIDVSHYSSGIYILNIHKADGSIITKKVMIQK